MWQVEGPLNSGVVFVHMLKPHDKNEWEYLLLALDVRGLFAWYTLSHDYMLTCPRLHSYSPRTTLA